MRQDEPAGYRGADRLGAIRFGPLRLGLVGLVAAGVAVFFARTPMLSWSITPSPPFVAGVVGVLVDLVRATRACAPYVCLLGLTALAGYWLLGHRSLRARLLNQLSRVSYVGVDHLDPHQSRGRVRRFVAGTGLATLAIVLVGATSGIENEVTNGPLRPVDAALQMLSGRPDPVLVLQSPDLTFMDDSSIPMASMLQLMRDAPFPVVPFGKFLFNLNGKSALEVSVPDALYSRLAHAPRPSSCADATLAVDGTVGVGVGGRVSVNGLELQVARVLGGVAQMNRSIALLADSVARDCIQRDTSTSYFGAVADATPAAVDSVIAVTGMEGLSAVSAGTFREHNRNFWRANGTPLLLQLILYLTLFSGFAAAGARQADLQRNSREIGMLHANGVGFPALRAVERRRVLRSTFISALIAGPLLVPVAAAFNASELGVQIGVGLTEWSVGTGLTLIAMLFASRRSLTQFERSLDLTLAVKG